MQQNGYEHSLGGARSDPMSTPAAAPINATAPKTNRLNIFFKSKHKKFEGINAGKLITQQKPTNQSIKSNQINRDDNRADLLFPRDPTPPQSRFASTFKKKKKNCEEHTRCFRAFHNLTSLHCCFLKNQQ
jgi:hypothetical protein